MFAQQLYHVICQRIHAAISKAQIMAENVRKTTTNLSILTPQLEEEII